MTEPRTGRELTPRPAPPPEEGIERFQAPETAHTIGLTEERAAKIVRQSANARGVAFLAVLLIALFVPIYWFYDLGVPAVADTSRLAKESFVQQVTDVQRGEALFLANCARCHGDQGQGGIGPPLDDQGKLYNAVTSAGLAGTGHLNPNYIRNVLTVGGRYVCGDAKSIMPIWADTNGGPLNYEQINDIVAYITSPNTITFEGVDPKTGQTVTLHPWKDPSYALPAGATPFPDCWRATPAPGASGSGGGSSAQPSAAGSNIPGATAPAPAGSGGTTTTTLNIAAQNIKFDQANLSAPANQAFTINFDNKDSGIAHNVTIYQGTSTSGTPVFAGTTFPGPATQAYQVPALAPGTYTFVCTVHPTLMSGTLTVK